MQKNMSMIEKFQWLLTQGSFQDYLLLTEQEKIAFEQFKQKLCQ